MTQKIFDTAVALANVELQKVVDYLTVHTSAWDEYTDLKMHYASFMKADELAFELNGAKVSFDSDYICDAFYIWCNMEMEKFEGYCIDEGIDFNKLTDQVGQSSRFYIGHIHGNCLEEILDKACDVFDIDSIQLQNGLIDINDSLNLYAGDADEMVEDLLCLVQNVYEDVTSYMEDIIKVYNYITNLKEKQYEAFKKFVREDWKATAF